MCVPYLVKQKIYISVVALLWRICHIKPSTRHTLAIDIVLEQPYLCSK